MNALLVAMVASVALLAPHGAMSSAANGSFRIVIHASNPNSKLPMADVQRLFLKKTREWDHGPRVIPVDQTLESPVRRGFSRDVLDRSVGAISKYWLTQVYSGRDTPPRVKGSDQAVLEFVGSNPGAISYVSSGTSLTKDVKAIEVTP